MSVIGAQNLKIAQNQGLQVVNGRDLAIKVSTSTLQADENGIGVKNGGITPAQLEPALASIQNDILKRGFWTLISTVHSIVELQQPAPLADALFVGKAAGGSVNGNGTVGVVSASFSDLTTETETDPGQGGLSSSPSANQPYNSADFPGQRGIRVVINKADGSDVHLSEVFGMAPGPDLNTRVYGYLSYRSDLAADSRWRLWYYFQATNTGLETPFTPDLALTNLSLYLAEIGLASNLPPRAGLGIVSPAGQAAAAVGPMSIGTAELDDGAVTSGKLANDAVTAAKLAQDAVTSSKLAPEAVISSKLADESVTSGKLASASVTTSKLSSESVTAAKLAAEAVTSSKLKMKRRFQRIVGASGNGPTLTLGRSILAGREEAVVVTEDIAFIDYVASSPGTSPSKQFTASGTTITLGYTQPNDAAFRVWFDSEDP